MDDISDKKNGGHANCPSLEEDMKVPSYLTSQSHHERFLDGRIRKRVEQEQGEEQQRLRQSRGKTDDTFRLRQLVEKMLQTQGNMAAGFVDLGNANDTEK